MKHYDETILKFSANLGKIDSIKDIRYQGKRYDYYFCVCGQKIKRGYMFKNIRTQNECVVGKDCLQYVAEYLGWS